MRARKRTLSRRHPPGRLLPGAPSHESCLALAATLRRRKKQPVRVVPQASAAPLETLGAQRAAWHCPSRVSERLVWNRKGSIPPSRQARSFAALSLKRPPIPHATNRRHSAHVELAWEQLNCAQARAQPLAMPQMWSKARAEASLARCWTAPEPLIPRAPFEPRLHPPVHPNDEAFDTRTRPWLSARRRRAAA